MIATRANILIRIGATMIAAAMLAACAAAPARSPDTHYELDVTMAPVTFGANGSMALRRVDIRGLQSGRSLITVAGESPLRFREERGHFWHVATPTLIERAFLVTMNDASTDMAFGTPDYVAPETLDVGMKVLSNEIPHAGLRAHPTQGTIPSEFANLIMKAISYEPEDRYESASQMQLALNRAMGGYFEAVCARTSFKSAILRTLRWIDINPVKRLRLAKLILGGVTLMNFMSGVAIGVYL